MTDPAIEWPKAMDAMLAAPDHHRLLLENDRVRVLETRIEPGDTVPLHTHQWPSTLYVLSWSDFIRRDAEGAITLDTRQANLTIAPGAALWSGPLPPHTLENTGTTLLHIISVELKNSTS